MPNRTLTVYKGPDTLTTSGFFILIMEQAFETPQRLTKEVVMASLISDITRHNLTSLLEKGKSMSPDRSTLSTDYGICLTLRDIYTAFEERRKQEDKPDKDRIAARKEAYDSIMKPIEELLERLEPEFYRINEVIVSEDRIKLAEIQKQNEIRTRHVSFVNETTQSVLNATDNAELTRLQKLVGTEMSKTKFYGDYKPILEESCKMLLLLVDGRKNLLKENGNLLQQKIEAEKNNDLVLVTRLQEQIEHNERVVIQNAESISQKAYAQIAQVALLEDNFTSDAISPRLHRWTPVVEDIEIMFKKMPELVDKVVNSKAMTAFKNSKEKAGELVKEEDNKFPGFKIIWKPYYVEIK